MSTGERDRERLSSSSASEASPGEELSVLSGATCGLLASEPSKRTGVESMSVGESSSAVAAAGVPPVEGGVSCCCSAWFACGAVGGGVAFSSVGLSALVGGFSTFALGGCCASWMFCIVVGWRRAVGLKVAELTALVTPFLPFTRAVAAEVVGRIAVRAAWYSAGEEKCAFRPVNGDVGRQQSFGRPFSLGL